MTIKSALLISTLSGAMILTGCQSMTSGSDATTPATAIGAVGGALIGGGMAAILGGDTEQIVGAAIAGAAVGGIAGYAVGSNITQRMAQYKTARDFQQGEIAFLQERNRKSRQVLNGLQQRQIALTNEISQLQTAAERSELAAAELRRRGATRTAQGVALAQQETEMRRVAATARTIVSNQRTQVAGGTASVRNMNTQNAMTRLSNAELEREIATGDQARTTLNTKVAEMRQLNSEIGEAAQSTSAQLADTNQVVQVAANQGLDANAIAPLAQERDALQATLQSMRELQNATAMPDRVIN